MAMDKCVDMQDVISRAKRRGLSPGRVKATTDGIQFTKGSNPRIETISWEEFEQYLNKRGLAVYYCGNWLKIMKA